MAGELFCEVAGTNPRPCPPVLQGQAGKHGSPAGASSAMAPSLEFSMRERLMSRHYYLYFIVGEICGVEKGKRLIVETSFAPLHAGWPFSANRSRDMDRSPEKHPDGPSISRPGILTLCNSQKNGTCIAIVAIVAIVAVPLYDPHSAFRFLFRFLFACLVSTHLPL